MTSEEARGRLDEILERMKADAEELNAIHLNHPYKVSTTLRDQRKLMKRWEEIADIIVERQLKRNSNLIGK